MVDDKGGATGRPGSRRRTRLAAGAGLALAASATLVYFIGGNSGAPPTDAERGPSAENPPAGVGDPLAVPGRSTPAGHDLRPTPPPYDPTRKRSLASAPVPLAPREAVEVSAQIPKGTELSQTRIQNAIGIGGGAAGAYGTRMGRGNGSPPTRPERPPPALPPPATVSPPADPPQSSRDLANELHTAAGREGVDPAVAIDNVLSRLDRRSGETPDMMFFRYWGDNPFVETAVDRLSTFSVDVDTASYTLLRSYLFKRGRLPPREAVRTEEFVNYFEHRYAPPDPDGGAFAVVSESAPSPFAHEPPYQLLKVGVKGREVSRAEREPCALVFVIDSSGSMRREDRLGLVKAALKLLIEELDEGDTIGIVTFDSTARKLLDPTPAGRREPILDAIAGLSPGNSTNADAGLRMGYEMAAANFLEGGANRVLLLSDGVANTGVTDPGLMLERVAEEREKGIYLTSVGVGMGNHNDYLLEQLADRGNGQCVYVDRIEEARRVFVENLTGTLQTIARDVKIQVEFDRENILRYRLLGYENRALADAAFRDNSVDAGEVGAGHEVTALYEFKPAPGATGKLATIRVRYLTPEEGEAIEIKHSVDARETRESFADASPRFQLVACVAEFAEILRDSYWARSGDLRRVANIVRGLLGNGPRKLGTDPDVVELVALVERADTLVRQRRAGTDETVAVLDLIKEVKYQRRQLDARPSPDPSADHRHLEELKRQGRELRRRLERLLDAR